MPKYNWATGPTEHTRFVLRKSRYARRGRGRAVCFHCRTTVEMYLLNGEGEEIFNTHYDQDRGNGYAGRGAGRAMGGGARRVGPNRENEICVGSDYAPIPLAYKFEDGSPLPYF